MHCHNSTEQIKDKINFIINITVQAARIKLITSIKYIFLLVI